MNAARPSDPAKPARSPFSRAWPRPAQLAAAFLLGAASALLGARLVGGPPARPLDYHPAPPIDLNRAGRSDLLQLPGVGPATADRIVAKRDAGGGFQSPHDLRSVPGVGPATMDRVRPWVAADGSPTPTKKDAPREPLDINSAPLDQLQTLPGIGPKIGQRIVDERERKPFQTVEELRRVAGIGVKTLDKLRPHIRVAPPADIATTVKSAVQ